MPGRKPTVPVMAFPIWDRREFVLNEKECAVLMPFNHAQTEKFFEMVVVPALMEAGMVARRADRSTDPVVIENIWALINESRLVLADISTDNPNVLYELGVAHTLGRPTIILRSGGDPELPFNVRHLRSIRYDAAVADPAKLKELLGEAVAASLKEFPTGNRLLDELEDSTQQWRRAARDFGALYDGERLIAIQRWVPESAMSDQAVAFCAASACQHGLNEHMVRWGTICNRRPAAAVDLAFGMFNHQRRPRLRIAYLISQLDPALRRQAISQVSEHGMQDRKILDAIRDGDVLRYVQEHAQELSLNPGELDETVRLFHDSQLVFERPLP